jgi:D-3-phosphoglycerate dehydrogenase
LAIERVLISEPTPHTAAVCAILGQNLRITRGPMRRAELVTAIRHCDAVFVRLGHRLDAEVLAAAPRLKVIATPTTGLTHIDVEAARTSGVDILCLREERQFLERLPATAELTWALLLAVVRKIVAASWHTLGGDWNRDLFWSTELAGKTLGVIGFGRIGQMVARYGAAFGMTVVAHDIDESKVFEIAQPVTKRALLETADFVTIHTHYEQGQPPLLSDADFDSMKRGCVLVNTARGELVDEYALIRAIRSGRLGGAGLDTVADEPSGKPELLTLQQTHNVVITPHIGGATFESIMATELFMARKLRTYIERANAVAD